MKLFAAILFMLVSLPIWFYLLYKILVMVDASELMWFLYWIYVPVTIFAGTVTKVFEKE